MKQDKWKKEVVQVGVLDSTRSTTYVLSLNIWYGEDSNYGYINKSDAIEHSLDNMGFGLNNIQWMETSKVSVDTNEYTFNRRLESI